MPDTPREHGFEQFERLAEAVSNSLAATTMGTDWAEAPEPSDEPGSEYVLRLTNDWLSGGVAHIDALTAAVEGMDGSRFDGVGGSWVLRAAVLAILRGES